MKEIPLHDHEGHFRQWRSPESIERLLAAERVSVIRDSKTGRLKRAFERKLDGSTPLQNTAHVGTKYSYRDHLPSGRVVHDLKRLHGAKDGWDYAPEHLRPIFISVLLDCLTSSQ